MNLSFSPARRAATLSLVALTIVLGTGAARGADSDYDGVPDHQDICPGTAQLQKLPADFRYRHAVSEDRYSAKPKAWPVDQFGCEPDSDDDGVVDSADYCRDDSAAAIAMGVAANGCPLHSDTDGTPDRRDRCPDTPRGVVTDRNGCPVPGHFNRPTLSQAD
jgi:hypothetical protein